jgi:hypothetical protein
MFASLVPIAGPLLLAVVINVCAALVTAGGRARRALGVCLGLACMTPAWLVPPEHTLIRSIWVIGTFMGAARTIDLARGHWPVRERLIHIFSVVDTRRLERTRPAFDGVLLAQAAAWEILAWTLYQQIPAASRQSGLAFWAWRWSFALGFIYTLTAGAYPLLAFAYRTVGFRTPPLHITPAAARSVQEFWGERWNRTVSSWLAETFFRPLARRRRPALGGLAAFTASALLHAYIVWVAVTWGQALVMLAFFLMQAVVIALERVLRVRAWVPWAGHVWTVAWMVGLSPLFSEPALWAFGI